MEWLDEDARKVVALTVFASSYLALAIDKIPGLNIDRAGVALVGAGLFIIVAGTQHALLTPELIARASLLRLDHVPILSMVTAVLSNLVTDVPAVLTMRPFVRSMPNHATA